MALTERLRAAIDASPLSQTEIARRAGVHKQTVTRIKSGRMKPSFEIVQKLAVALDLPLAEFAALAEEHGRPEDPEEEIALEISRLQKSFRARADLCRVQDDDAGAAFFDRLHDEASDYVRHARTESALLPPDIRKLRDLVSEIEAMPAADREFAIRAIEHLVKGGRRG